VVHSAIPADTSASEFAMLTERWSTMEIGERADLIQQLCIDVEQLARAGIHARYPDFSEMEICHELARRRYGSALADAAYAGLLRHG
jgi:hypothetical protein